ncbi:MAG: hypothetical protein HQM13_18795 [SAR324 cluster bacterium]|nr:hypothetical protein [SAR324 cluster bacterium]
MMKSIAVVLAFTGFFPSLSLGCSVCFVGKEATMAAYYGTAIVLSLLPLAMVGALAYWVFRRYQQHDSVSAGEYLENNESAYPKQQSAPTQ